MEQVKHEAYALPVVGMGPLWSSIEHGHSEITAYLETATFSVWKRLNLGI